MWTTLIDAAVTGTRRRGAEPVLLYFRVCLVVAPLQTKLQTKRKHKRLVWAGSCHFLTLDCRSVGLACIAIGFPVLSTDRLLIPDAFALRALVFDRLRRSTG